MRRCLARLQTRPERRGDRRSQGAGRENAPYLIPDRGRLATKRCQWFSVRFIVNSIVGTCASGSINLPTRRERVNLCSKLWPNMVRGFAQPVLAQQYDKLRVFSRSHKAGPAGRAGPAPF